MTEDRHVTESASPFQMGGQEFRARPLSDRAIEDINEWLRTEFVRSSRRRLKSVGGSAGEYERDMSAVLVAAETLDWRGGRGSALMSKPSGFSRIVWEMLRPEHPDLTQAQVLELLQGDPDAVEAANEAFRRTNLVKKETPEGEQSARPGT